MMEEFELNEGYDGVDDNVEILLEDALEDPNQAYIYIRIKALPDEEELMIEQMPDKDNWIYSPNTDMVTILSNGSESQLAMMFIELFQMNPAFMEAVIVAIEAMKKYGARKREE